MSRMIPAGVEIQLEIRFGKEGELLQQGILSIGDSEAGKDLELVGIAIQRGAYELFFQLWKQYLIDQVSANDIQH